MQGPASVIFKNELEVLRASAFGSSFNIFKK